MAKRKKTDEIIIATKELIFQDEEKEKLEAELIIANKELAFQNEEKENRAAELIIANKELAFQNGAQYFIGKPSEFSQFKKIIHQTITTLTVPQKKAQRTRENFVITV